MRKAEVVEVECFGFSEGEVVGSRWPLTDAKGASRVRKTNGRQVSFGGGKRQSR